MSEYATFLKVGAASLMLRMLEEPNVVLRDMTLENPIRAIREISHDTTCTRKVRLANGREVSALEIQSEYLNRAIRFAETRGVTPIEKQALTMWEHCHPIEIARSVSAASATGSSSTTSSRPTAPSTTCRSPTRGSR